MFAICSVMDMKGKLSNVSFGGNWSEDLLARDHLLSVLHVLDHAASVCADQDMRGEETDAALSYVEENIEKGERLAKAFRAALDCTDPWQRQRVAQKVGRQIRSNAGEL